MSQEQVLDLCNRWADAEQRADAAAIDALLAEDFVAVGPLGFTLSKADWLARHTAGDLKYERFQFTETQARTFGTTRIVIAHQVAKGAHQGHPIPTNLRATAILVERNAGWQVVGMHMSFIAGTPGAPPIPGRPNN
jgi:ketosteroid isomerase-like protein